jgi:hypothetical protein
MTAFIDNLLQSRRPAPLQRQQNLSDMTSVHPGASDTDAGQGSDDPTDVLQKMHGEGLQPHGPGEPGIPFGPATAKLASVVDRLLAKMADGVMPPPGGMPPVVTTGNEPQKPLATLKPKMPAKKAAAIDPATGQPYAVERQSGLADIVGSLLPFSTFLPRHRGHRLVAFGRHTVGEAAMWCRCSVRILPAR